MREREISFLKIVVTADIHQKIADFRQKWEASGVPPEQVSEVVVKVDTGSGKGVEAVMTLSGFLHALGLSEAAEQIEPCATCGGAGKVAAMETVYPGEPHQAEVGDQDCPDCTDQDEDDGEDQEADGF